MREGLSSPASALCALVHRAVLRRGGGIGTCQNRVDDSTREGGRELIGEVREQQPDVARSPDEVDEERGVGVGTDLSARLGLGVTDPGPRHVIIITVVQSQTIGILAEVVSDIITVQEEDIQPVPDIVADTVKSFISGVVIVNGEMIRKLDLSRVLPAASVEI